MSDTRENAWERWKQLVRRAAAFQARLVLSLFYWVGLAPFALLARDPLEMEGEGGGRWRPPPETDPESQF